MALPIAAMVLTAARALATTGGRAAAKKALQDKFKDATASQINAAISAGSKASKLSDKTGKPISSLVKMGTGAQTVTKNVAKKAMSRGAKAGAVAGGLGVAGLDALVDSIDKISASTPSAKPASSSSRKSPEGGQTIKENRRVVSETKLAKGGMTKQKYSKGGALKKAPTDAKGLKKLPTEVRNKMGYMSKGGAVKPASKSKKK